MHPLLLALALAAPVPEPDTLLVLLRGQYLDVEAGVLRENGALVLRDGRIAEVHTPDERFLPPSGARVRDLSGQTILPGLIDAHVHLTLSGDPAANALATLRAGFTTVVDLGSANGAGARLRDAIENGTTRGPRIVAAGSWIGARDGVCEFGGATVASPAEAGARARGDLAAGADLFKVCVTGWPQAAVSAPDSVELKPALLAPVLAAAKQAKRPVYAHAIGQAGALLAVQSGVRALAHTPVVDSAAATTIARSRVPILSTLATLGAGPDGDAVRRSFALLRQAGVTVVLGTDAGVLPHGQNAREVEALVANGLSPLEALRAATLAPARLLGRNDLGRIARGAAADLVMVTGNPLEDISLTTHPTIVVSAGKIVD